MAIKFLKAHSVAGSFPTERYTAGQVVQSLPPESERHFVSRGAAAYLIDGKLFDHSGKEVAEKVIEAQVFDVANNRDEAGRDGRLEDGTPQRASSGPGEAVMTTSGGRPAPAAEAVSSKPASAAKAKGKGNK